MEVLSALFLAKVPVAPTEVARRADIVGGAGPGNMPRFWIDPVTGHLWYEGVPGMFRINAAGHLEYVFTTP